jgi:mRNA interferase RelE/StbE
MPELEYSSRAADWLREADPDAREQVMSRLEQAVDFPEHFLTRLSDSPYYRLRAGDYRAIVDWRRNDEPELLFVRTIGHRRNVYD